MSALDTYASPLHELRALLNLELAQCDNAEELLTSAKQHVTAAAQLDYSGCPDDVAHFHLDRPLDRHIEPLLRGLMLRTSMSDTPPSDPQDAAQLLVERATEARTSAAAGMLLSRALTALRGVELVQPPVAASAVDADVATQKRARRLTELWASVVRVAYKRALPMLVLESAPSVAWSEWRRAVDREMVLLQVRRTLPVCLSRCDMRHASACTYLGWQSSGQMLDRLEPFK